MDPKTKQLIEEAEARAAKATPGPWFDARYQDDEHGPHIEDSDEHTVAICAIGRPERDANAKFIEAARTDIPALCSAVREQDKRARDAEVERDAFGERIKELEAKQLASWNEFENEALDAIGSEVIGMTVDAGSDIPGMIRRLHDRYRAEIRREQALRIEAEKQLATYKRITSIKKK